MKRIFAFSLLSLISMLCLGQSKALVFQSDFGLKDGAVAAMKGVAYALSNDLSMFDLTHEIPAYNIWEGAYRLNQTAAYWPAGTVFVSVVDPGVGSSRRSIVMKSKSGHYFVTPDNGTLTFIAENLGVEEVRVIDETRNRLKNSSQSYTFHGRDVYAFTGAKLAAGIISFEQVGDSVFHDVVRLTYQKAANKNGVLYGTIDILDIQYGNLWTNIGNDLLKQINIKPGDEISIAISNAGKVVYKGKVLFGNTFADVSVGKPVAYLNSLLQLAIAINQGNFAAKYKIGSGGDWTIEIKK
ncbi:MAG TPA: S-adenosyl-l-methionine hydroxide adenosyltransferase family protein [Chryseosolibacter sp.]